MTHTLGIDIGTFETKGVLVDAHDGRSPPRRPARTRCWCPAPAGRSTGPRRTGGAISSTSPRRLLAQSGLDPQEIKAVAASAIGPCMLPVDAAGAPLMNGVLYGVDTRATDQIAA
jgi:xylulokinase